MKECVCNFTLLFCLFIATGLSSQDYSLAAPGLFPSDSCNRKIIILRRQSDVLDVIRMVLRKDPNRRSVEEAHVPGKIRLAGLPVLGYTLQTGFAAALSANLAYYSSPDPEIGISSITVSFAYSQYNQIIFPLQASLWSKNGKTKYLADWRYLKYPSVTYGLGGQSALNNENKIDYSYLRLHQSVEQSVAKNLFIGAGLDLDYYWNLKEQTEDAGKTTDFDAYGFGSRETAAGLSLSLNYDSRKNPINPEGGTYLTVAYQPKFTFMGSDSDWQSLLVEYKVYIRPIAASPNVLAVWSYNWFTLGGRPPYLLLPSVGWDAFNNTGRGYQQGRFRSNNMIYLETEYRFGITRNRLIGGVVFANAETYSGRENALSAKTVLKNFDTPQPGFGVGLRIKMNKFSGANLCIDYGWGAQGSGGIAVNLGEVF